MAAEQLRRILLKEMGITSWFPRVPQPGAARSHEQCLQIFLEGSPSDQQSINAGAGDHVAAAKPVQHSLPSANSSGTPVGPGAQPPSVPSAPPVAPPVVQLAALLANKPVTPIIPAAPSAQLDNQPSHIPDTAQNSGGGTDAQDVGAEAFGFSWFHVDKKLAVLAMLPPGNSRLTGSCRQMLARLLAALHTPWQSVELVDLNFHWPFADDLGLPADTSAVRQAVEGFIARRLGEHNCAMLLVLCDGLPWFLQPATAGSQQSATGTDDAAELRVHRQFGFAMLATHSLHAMEADAGLKREAWQSMKLLRERLNR